MNVYVVMGTTGEYSDRSEWSVAAYDDRKLADKHADEATKFAVNAFKELRSKVADYNEPPNPWDEDMLCDYTGTDYYVLEVPFLTELPVVE